MLSAAKWGALVGVATYLISQLITIISDVVLGPGAADLNHPGRITLGCLNLLIIAFAFSAAGFYTGRETRQAGLGPLAGMITFAVYGTLLAMYSFGGRMQMGGANLGEQVIVGLTTVFFYLMIAAMIGWLGARPGAGRARRRTTATPPATLAMTEAAPETAPEAASEQMSQQ